MFTCIACSKQGGDEGGEEGGGARGSGTPSTKEAVKSLTAQVPYPTPSLALSLSLSLSLYIFLCLSLFAFVHNLFFFSIFFHICENKQNHKPIRTKGRIGVGGGDHCLASFTLIRHVRAVVLALLLWQKDFQMLLLRVTHYSLQNLLLLLSLGFCHVRLLTCQANTFPSL